MTRYDAIKEALENLGEWEIVDIWNEYCSNNSYDDDRIETMNMFDEYCDGMTPTEIAQNIDSDFNINEEYFQFGIYGFTSTNDAYDFISIDDLATYIDDNDDELGNSDIRDAIDEWEEENEEEESEDDE